MDLALHTMPSSFINEYDVFISFRGEDTRKSFTSHLYKALCDKQINVYIDEKTLGKGEEISSALLKAIQKSKISLIIFSENYATSTWCLEELVHILKCREENGQIVIPIFYGVDPSHVRKQEGSFAHAFVTHQQCYEDRTEKLHQWRAALDSAGNLSGWDTRDRYESILIEEIVQNVASKLRSRTTADFEGLVGINRPLKKFDVASKLSYASSRIRPRFEDVVGMNRQLQEFESLLLAGSPDVRVLGIWGMGGIGKTTLARLVFNRLSSEFEGCCFLNNIRDASAQNGLAYLEYRLFSELLKEEDIDMVNHSIKYKIRRTKVLIVLDDVDDTRQLERLAGDRTWFGPGSRVIITTRNAYLLHYCCADAIYEVDGLSFDEALELFHFCASRGRSFISDHAQLSRSVIHYAHGMPLALIVLGRLLYGRSREQWEYILQSLKMVPVMEINFLLKVSYDGLENMDKAIFLDIACFLKGRVTDSVERILEKFGSDARIGIEDLTDKSLISINGDGEIDMQGLIREMGWEIVRQSRDERNYSSSFNKGIGARGRYFDMSNIEYEELPRRRVLGNRYHSCYDYPQKSLPSKISPHNLVEFDMPSIKLKQYRNEVQDSSSGTTVRLIISYEGQWRETRGCWSFRGKKTKGIIVSKDITYYQLVERLSHSLMVDQSLYDLDMRFLVVSLVPLPPVEIRHDDDVKFLIETSSEGNPGYPLCITLVKKDSGQHVLVDNDRNVVNFLFQWRRKMRIF